MTTSLAIGLQLTVMGMGLVFALLALLWGLIALLGWTDRRTAASGVTAPAAEEPAAEFTVPPELAAAITVAVLAHRAERRREAGPEVRSQPPSTRASRWVVIGRARQTQGWEPGRRG